LNNCHCFIKFEAIFSTEKVNFLDTVTCIVDDDTTVYTKPTDRKQYLFFNSSHPRHTTRAIPYSQAIRYRRINSQDNLLENELTSLCTHFANRGYPSELLNNTMERIKGTPRASVLQYKDKNDKKAGFVNFSEGRSFLPCIIPFHLAFEHNLPSIIKQLWLEMISNDSNIHSVLHA